MTKDTLEFQIEAAKSRYESEVARRDSVRATIALPVAALSFSFIGMGAIAANIRLSFETPGFQVVSFTCVISVIAALYLLFSAIASARDIDFNPQPPAAEVFEVHEQARDVEQELFHAGMSPTEAKEAALASTWRLVTQQYREGFDRFSAANDRNLALQREILSKLASSLALLIFALFLIGAQRVWIDNRAGDITQQLEQAPHTAIYGAGPYVGSERCKREQA